MREVRPTHRVDPNFLGSMRRTPDDVQALNLIDTKAMLDGREERDSKMLAEALTSPVGEVSFVFLSNNGNVRPVVEITSDGRKARKVSNVDSNREVGKKDIL